MRFKVKIFYIFLFVFCSFLTGLSDEACTFPDALLGSWERGSDTKTLVISTSSVSGLNITHNSEFLEPFVCDMTNGTTQYVIRASYFSNSYDMYGYLCFDFEEKSANVYFLYILTVIPNQEVKDKRQTDSYTLAEVCTKTKYEVAYTTLIKTGATDIVILCPSIIFGTYNYTVDNTLCPGDSELNVCVDRMSIIVNYTMCSEIVGYSDMGQMDCIGHIVRGNITYLSVYMRDTTVQNRTTCFAIEVSNNNVLMTSYEKDCLFDQNATIVSSPGRSFQMVPVVTCPFTNDPDYTVIIVVVVLLILLIIAAIVVTVAVCYWRKKKALRAVNAEASSPTDKPTNTTNTATPNGNATTPNGNVTTPNGNATAPPEMASNGHAQPVIDEKPMANGIN